MVALRLPKVYKQRLSMSVRKNSINIIVQLNLYTNIGKVKATIKPITATTLVNIAISMALELRNSLPLFLLKNLSLADRLTSLQNLTHAKVIKIRHKIDDKNPVPIPIAFKITIL